MKLPGSTPHVKLRRAFAMKPKLQPTQWIAKKPHAMIRHAFRMKLKPGNAAEYKRRHDEIWPELAKAIREAGISDYSIFFEEATLTLFAVQKQTPGNTAADLPNHPAVKKWWAYMAPLMEVNPDNSPACGELKRVFHLD